MSVKLWRTGVDKLLIVSNIDRIDEYKKIASEYKVGFEYDDFYAPDVINDDRKVREIIEKYKKAGVPKHCTLHGAFFDLVAFSEDEEIRHIAYKRMRQSMEIAKEIGAYGVVFHTNVNPYLISDNYEKRVVEFSVEILEKLLNQYKDIDIYLENMFDATPEILSGISERLKKYDNYGVCFDYAHAYIYGGNIEKWVNDLKPYIKHIHINDNDLKSDLHLALGEGKIDWYQFMNYYNKYFNDCTVLIETTLPENQVKSLKFMEKLQKGLYKKETEEKEIVNKELEAEELLEKIFHYMTKLVETKEFSETVDLLTDLGSMIVNSDRASFWFWDTNAKQYWTLSAKGNSRITIPEGTGIVGKTIMENRTILCNDPYNQPYFNGSVDKKTGYITRSTLCMPITNVDNEVIGAFQVINKIDENGKSGKFDERDINRLTIVVAYCEKSLESHLLHNVALRDRLTGLKNRYSFYEYYNKKVLPKVKDIKFSFIMCDIDFFKKVNDTYGHNAGDDILKYVSNLFKESVNADDEIVRWGGEEFIFILKDRDIDSAVKFAEQLRSRIESSDFLVEDKVLNITMSFGVSELDIENTLEQNVKIADERLYKAKREGRNRVVSED